MSAHLQTMEEFDAAEQVLVGFLALNPNDAASLSARAGVYEGAGDPEKAEETLLQLMDMNEDIDAEITQQLIHVQVSLEKFAEALSNADAFLEQDPANIAERLLRVEALTELGDETEAEAERDRIARLMPEPEAEAEAALPAGPTAFADAAP